MRRCRTSPPSAVAGVAYIAPRVGCICNDLCVGELEVIFGCVGAGVKLGMVCERHVNVTSVVHTRS